MRQWAEIQAYSRKMSLTEFLSFAEQKKKELQTALEVCYITLAKFVTLEWIFAAETGEFSRTRLTG